MLAYPGRDLARAADLRLGNGVRDANAWYSRSVDVVDDVADQKNSNRAVPRYRYRTELVWRIVVPTAHVDSTFNIGTMYRSLCLIDKTMKAMP